MLDAPRQCADITVFAAFNDSTDGQRRAKWGRYVGAGDTDYVLKTWLEVSTGTTFRTGPTFFDHSPFY